MVRVPHKEALLRTLKAAVKSALSPDHLASLRIFLAERGRRTGTSFEEMWLDRLARRNEIGTFIQIGANDGDGSDPVASIIRRHSLRGVMVEPIPFYFEKLQRHLAGRSGITLVNKAIAQATGQRRFYHLPPDANDIPEWAHGLGSFNRDVILSHAALIPNLANIVVETEVPCVSFSELLDEVNVDAFDLLVTDTEGYDFEILRQVEFDRCRPKVIVYESKHLSALDATSCGRLLAEHQYLALPSNDNVIAFRTDVAARWSIRGDD